LPLRNYYFLPGSLRTRSLYRSEKAAGDRYPEVVGATVNSIVLLLSKDFLILIAVALLIAFPLSCGCDPLAAWIRLS